MPRINRKRVNQPRATAGPHGSDQIAVDLVYRDGPVKDSNGRELWRPQGTPVVSLIPVTAKGTRPREEARMDIPVECLDEVIQWLENVREEAEKSGDQRG